MVSPCLSTELSVIKLSESKGVDSSLLAIHIEISILFLKNIQVEILRKSKTWVRIWPERESIAVINYSKALEKRYRGLLNGYDRFFNLTTYSGSSLSIQTGLGSSPVIVFYKMYFRHFRMWKMKSLRFFIGTSDFWKTFNPLHKTALPQLKKKLGNPYKNFQLGSN